MKFLKRWFIRQQKPIKEICEELSIGDIVSLEYKHPREIGIVNGDSLTYTRLNREELEKRKIRGTISSIRKGDLPMKIITIEVATYESPAMPGKLRKFLFLPEELKEIRRMEK